LTAKGNLLARKEKLLRQLEDGSSDGQRDEIERQIAQIDTALGLLEALGAPQTTRSGQPANSAFNAPATKLCQSPSFDARFRAAHQHRDGVLTIFAKTA